MIGSHREAVEGTTEGGAMADPRKVVTLAATLALAVLTVACSKSSDGGGGDTSGSSTISSTMKDFAISLSSTNASPGEVTFKITNDGPSTHEFVVIKTDDAPEALPTQGPEVIEDAAGLSNIGEAEDIETGGTATLTLTLESGNYVVICNLEGHYKGGMHAGFTVA
jgi:uncharacterized cupredoxin-like copper-binding protein